MDTMRIHPEVAAGDPILSRAALRCDEEFLSLLEEDYEIPMWALKSAFLGVPRVDKVTASIVCGLAELISDPAKFVVRWAWQNQHGIWRYDSSDDEQEEE